jgi:Flp pilus assembly protein CpaB
MITISILILGVLVAMLGLLAAIASMAWTATQILTAPPVIPETPAIPPTPPVPGQRGDLVQVLRLGADGWKHDGWVQAGSDAHAHVLARRGLRTADELGVQD